MDDLELSLRESARRKPDASPVLERPPRPPDAYTLGNHPAFRGIGGGALGGLGGVVGNDEALDTFNADAAANATLAAAARKREVEAVVVKVCVRAVFFGTSRGAEVEFLSCSLSTSLDGDIFLFVSIESHFVPCIFTWCDA